MGFKLANIDGKSALIHGDSYYDINTISQGKITSDPSKILNSLDDLHELSSKIDNFEPDYVIIFPWNIYKEIKDNIYNYSSKNVIIKNINDFKNLF